MPTTGENEMGSEQVRDLVANAMAEQQAAASEKVAAGEQKNGTGDNHGEGKVFYTKLRDGCTETVIDTVANFVRRFVFFKGPCLYILVAAWIVATYMYKDFDYTGYLLLHSPEPESGKTTVLEILNHLVANSGGLEISPTEANLFRTADGYTQLFDEVDAWSNRELLRSVLNAGFKKGGVVTRSEKGEKGNFIPKKFSVYAPRALAGIGMNILHRTTLDRTFAIAMVRQKSSEKRERLRLRDVGEEVAMLRKSIAEWVEKNRIAINARYRKPFEYFEKFRDRTIDIAEPAASIVEIAFRGSSELECKRGELLEAIRMTRSEQRSETSDHAVLRHLLTLTETEDPLVGNASELVALCGNLAEPPNEYALGTMLKRYGFKTKSVRKKGGDSPKHRYSLTRKSLQEAVDRWAPVAAEGEAE